ncbi:hypothetical protein KCP73_01520 [Salmonella enterica subsp. enterica]|nr:hypothetical protein KCP73_01520 [Salmonella enterica subsp. enterica]
MGAGVTGSGCRVDERTRAAAAIPSCRQAADESTRTDADVSPRTRRRGGTGNDHRGDGRCGTAFQLVPLTAQARRVRGRRLAYAQQARAITLIFLKTHVACRHGYGR